jgi:hypothetical protein
MIANTKEELGFLLYLETQAVDCGGKLQSARMNADDLEISKRWNESGFIQFGRIAFHDIKTRGDTGEYPRTHWVVLSDEAWKEAHAERKARCQRIMDRLTVKRLGYEED